MHDPSTYLSFSGGRYRVINHGMPISNDKETAEEALAAARFFRLKVSDRVWWDGDAGEWREWTSSGSPAARNRAEGVVARPGSFEAGWNDWVASRGEGRPRASSKQYKRGWTGAGEAARSGISVEPIGSPAYYAALEEVRGTRGANRARLPRLEELTPDQRAEIEKLARGSMQRDPSLTRATAIRHAMEGMAFVYGIQPYVPAPRPPPKKKSWWPF